jgi:hypothetical protein
VAKVIVGLKMSADEAVVGRREERERKEEEEGRDEGRKEGRKEGKEGF